MGNKPCGCCSLPKNEQSNELFEHQVTNMFCDSIKEPILNQSVKQNLLKYKPFKDKLPEETRLKEFGNAIFRGQYDEIGRPKGYGMMMYNNESVFVGKFVDGRANGPGHYVLSDGSYYHGRMADNVAECSQAIFQSNNFRFEGQVKDNNFEGKGKEKGKNYTFQGTYSKGKRVEGILKWTEPSADTSQEQNQFQYTGSFNSNGKFEGPGVMICPAGKYEGQFKDGLKHGKGEFNFKSGQKYIGEYQNGIRQGTGTIYRKSGGIGFCGEIINGVPNGRGYIVGSKNEHLFTRWLEGMDQKGLPQQFVNFYKKKNGILKDEKKQG